MALCPGGPVGSVMSKQGRLLLPRRMTIERIVIERRGPGLPSGRIIVSLSGTESGTVLTIDSGPYPIVLVVSAAIISVLAFGSAQVAGGAGGSVVGAVLAILETVRWRRGLAAVNADAEWLARELGS